MTITIPAYPSAQQIYTELREFISMHDTIPSDWDEFIYEFISDNYDSAFDGDDTWFNEDETDVKDELRDEVMELLGV